MGLETCDAGNSPGCLSDCSGVDIGYECDGATPDLCSPICGDGRVISPEICDDGPETHSPPFEIGGCLPDCSLNDPKWECLGGNFTT